MTKNVIVVGCGLAGLSMALALVAKDNNAMTVDLIEKRDNFDSRGATFGLAPNGQIALEEICPDVLRRLKEVGMWMEKVGGYMFPWWEVRDALLDAVRRHSDRITIHLGKTMKDVVDEGDDPIVVTFQDSDLILKGDVLIGADGVHSYVRTKILDLPPAIPTGARVWRGRLNVNDIPSLSHLTNLPLAERASFGTDMIVFYFNYHSVLPGTIAWVASSKVSDFAPGVTTPVSILHRYVEENPTSQLDGEEKRKEDEKVNTMKKVFDHSLPCDLTSASELSIVNLREFDGGGGGWGGRGRITLIGDAAHALRPAAGLGGSMAFEDVVILSRMLASSDLRGESSVLENRETITTTLRKFEAKRLPRVKSISDDQTMRSEANYKKDVTVKPWSDKYREWLFMGPDAPSDPPEV